MLPFQSEKHTPFERTWRIIKSIFQGTTREVNITRCGLIQQNNYKICEIIKYILDPRSLRNIMKIENPLSDTVQRNLLIFMRLETIVSLVLDNPEISALGTVTCSHQ